jgi:hypothetical protein
MPEARSRCAGTPASTREAHLLKLAREVEGEDPVLACELRGIAQHEAALRASVPARPGASLWQRLAARWAPAPGWR